MDPAVVLGLVIWAGGFGAGWLWRHYDARRHCACEPAPLAVYRTCHCAWCRQRKSWEGDRV